MRYLFFLSLFALHAEIHPIQFGIPEGKIVTEIPQKTQDFASLIPGQLDTYIYETEKTYYQGYQEAYFAVTTKKGGWDCLRHYEILANGCIPYFVDIEECDPNTLPFLPKKLLLEAMHLEGVSYSQIDHMKFNQQRYYEILNELLTITRNSLTTKSMAQYLLQTAHYSGGKILYLSQDPSPDYLRCLTLIGLKEALGIQVIDVPKIEHIYDSCNEISHLYGKGMTYTRIVPDEWVDREHIAERIQAKEFALIIYGSVHRGLPFLELVTACYASEQIVYLCGEDIHTCEFTTYIQNSPLFLREYENNF